MPKTKKFYVVWTGRNTGVFESWAQCKAQVEGYAQAQYKAFESKAQAEQMFKAGYQAYLQQRPQLEKSKEEKKAQAAQFVGKPIQESLAVDAACAGNPGELEYRGVYTKSKEVLFHKKFPVGTNNIGEFLAIVHALAYLQKLGKDTPIYSDSETAIGWTKKKKAKTKLAHTPETTDLLDLVARAEKWLAENTYSNKILKWATDYWGEIPADFGRK
jgi:ribonuclease HI